MSNIGVISDLGDARAADRCQSSTNSEFLKELSRRWPQASRKNAARRFGKPCDGEPGGRERNSCANIAVIAAWTRSI
jgi:hypothetical protein